MNEEQQVRVSLRTAVGLAILGAIVASGCVIWALQERNAPLAHDNRDSLGDTSTSDMLQLRRSLADLRKQVAALDVSLATQVLAIRADIASTAVPILRKESLFAGDAPLDLRATVANDRLSPKEIVVRALAVAAGAGSGPLPRQLLQHLVRIQIVSESADAARVSVTEWGEKLQLARWESAELLAGIAQSERKFDEARTHNQLILDSSEAPEYDRVQAAAMNGFMLSQEGRLAEAERSYRDLVSSFGSSLDTRVQQVCNAARDLSEKLKNASASNR